MPLKNMSVAQADERYRQARKSALEALPEWIQLKERMNAGIKPGDAIVVELPKDSKIKNVRATLKRRARNYSRKMQFSYSVRAMRDNSGVDVVIVANESAHPTSSRKSK
jgi:hypothetical protein